MFSKPSVKTASLLILLLGLLFSLVATSAAQTTPTAAPEPDTRVVSTGEYVVLRSDDWVSSAKPVLPPAHFDARDPDSTATATIIVNYVDAATTWDLNPQAKTAFQFAVDIWETLINSPVPIVVNAEWTPLDPGVLGSAGPYTVHRNNVSFPRASTWYPGALANALAGADLNGGSPEVVARFSSVYANWYFGTGSTTPSTDYNFTTVVLHELGHGLGFLGSMSVSSGIGSWGYPGSLPTPINPLVYDHYSENNASQPLLSFPNLSTLLGDQLISNALYFNGPNANAANGGARVALYAPTTWRPGSSYSHLGEIYNSTPNALMTYSLAKGETNYNPGPIVLGIFRDMGWSTGPIYTPPTFFSLPDQLLLKNESRSDALDLTHYTILGTSGLNELTYSIINTPDPAAGVTLNGAMISINPTTNWLGNALVTVQVEDGTASDTASFTVRSVDQILYTYLPSIAR